MKRLLTNLQMRQADAYTINEKGVSSQTLMRRAGEALAAEVLRVAKERAAEKITVVCGTGNNGGDGYVCAEQLIKSGVNADIYAISGKFSPDCERERSAYTGGYATEIKADVIVDCIFGTGLAREISGEYAEVIEKINSSGAYVISADIPSGINGDSGQISGVAVRADLTVAIAEYKAGHYLCDGLDCCGETVKADIGITVPHGDFIYIYEDDDIKPFFPKRRRNSHKGTFGSANLIAGSGKYAGAAALAVGAALKSGCGYVKLTTSENVKFCLVLRFAQVIYPDECDLTSDCIAVGSGCGVSAELYDRIAYLLKNYTGTLIIDADGLNSLARYGTGILKQKSCGVILTPHIKEFSRISGLTAAEISADPIARAKKFASEYGVTLVLKNASTIICDGARTALNVRGDSALAKGGSGDMLTGFMCGTVARGIPPFEAAVCAAYVLGKAAEISSEQNTAYCATAREIIKNLHIAVKDLTV